MTESTALVSYADRLAEMAQAQARKERPSTSTIGTRAGVLSHNGAAVPNNKLDVIILAAGHSNLYYDGPFDPDNVSSPVCFAHSEDGENMVPHPASAKPQHTDCASCPMNAWGSDPRGGRGRACKNVRILALIPGSTKAADVQTAEMAILKLPVMSGANLKNYVQKCAVVHQRPTIAVVTQIGTVPDQKSQFKVTFQDIAKVEDDMLEGLFSRQESAMQACMPVYEAPSVVEEGDKPAKSKKF